LWGIRLLDIILVTNEVVEDIRSHGKSGAIVKVDFDKTYDSMM